MDIGITHFLIVCPLVFLAGFVDAVAGGGGLISLPAYLISGFPAHFAIGTNKLSSGMGTSLATYRYAKSGYIPYKQAGFCAVVALMASALGSKIALLISADVFEIILLVILPITAIYIFRTKKLESDKEKYSEKKSIFLSMIIAGVIGMYDGFYGPGTGTFLILLLTQVVHMRLSEANGISKVINLSTNIASLVVMLINGKVVIVLGLAAGVFSIAGNYIGTKMFDKGGARIVKPVVISVLTIFFVKIVYQMVF